MIKLDEFYYDNIEIENPKQLEDIYNLLEPIISDKLLFKIDSMLGELISDSGLSGFKQGVKFGEIINTVNKELEINDKSYKVVYSKAGELA